MKRMRIVDCLKSDIPIDDCIVAGWVRTKRESKENIFIEINDGSCLSNLQVVVGVGDSSFDIAQRLHTGASVYIQGSLVPSPAVGQTWELKPNIITVFGDADPESYPLQKKRHSFEFLREIAHLRPRTNTMGAIMRIRNQVSYAIHTFFQQKGFLYVHTPIITTSDCEGAGEMFQVTTLDLHNLPMVNGAIDYTKDFFGAKAALTVSGQLEGELLAMALGDIYTFGPTFRAENSNTTRHLSEFWMVEPEMTFATLEDDCSLAEEFLRFIFKWVLEKCQEDMQFFNERIKPGIIQNLELIVNSSFEIVTYTEAIEKLQQSNESFEFLVHWGMDLQTEHERWLTEKYFKKPIIVIHYPKTIKAFYMKLNDDNNTVRAMDVLVPGVGEIIGGSEREDRYDVLITRMKEMGLNPDDYWWYMDIRKFGSAPHAGFGLGFERAIQFITGMQNIRDVIPFPRTPGNARF
ncbi:MAG TPA: asparagine--tRNA ligase [Spirochaetota bacterium]|nr:asparagine--tRNA ligase [Spirochaetota bacterium]HOM09491.1 asparagine--tRNA ligase [Spirochaetota bacterium]